MRKSHHLLLVLFIILTSILANTLVMAQGPDGDGDGVPDENVVCPSTPGVGDQTKTGAITRLCKSGPDQRVLKMKG